MEELPNGPTAEGAIDSRVARPHGAATAAHCGCRCRSHQGRGKWGGWGTDDAAGIGGAWQRVRHARAAHGSCKRHRHERGQRGTPICCMPGRSCGMVSWVAAGGGEGTGEASRRAAGGIRRGGPARGVCVQLRPAAEAAADERLRAGARVQQGCGNRGRMREDGGHWPAGAGQQWRRAWLMRPRGHRRIAPCGPASASDCARTSACRRGAGGLPPAAYAGWVGSRAQVPLRRLG